MQKLSIVKVGGKVIEEVNKLNQLLDAFSGLEGVKILVHGGGKKASELLLRLGIPPKMINGRRITDETTLEVVTMVYAGLINKKIVSLLQARNCNAIGLSGADGNVIQAHKRIVKDIDYGFAGDIDRINAKAIANLLEGGFQPVFCAITHDGQGQLLNTNADTIAAELAKAMAGLYEVKLYYCFEKKGVLMDPDDDDSAIESLNLDQYQHYKSEGIISDGMIPKLDNAFSVLQQQAKAVIIGDLAALEGKTGTKLTL
jgi:acetylglutamate kinase